MSCGLVSALKSGMSHVKERMRVFDETFNHSNEFDKIFLVM